MPTLKQLTCSVEWSGSGTPLQEHSTTYVDGFVKTFIAIPSMPTPFSIRLRSSGYIAPGLAMFVYMDGVYQCNRNRHNLKIPDGMSKREKTEVNFHVRQKEEMMPDGTFRAQEWRFQKVDVVSNPSELRNIHVPQDAEFVGTIEVVVLRCLGTEASNETVLNHDVNRSTFAAQALNSSKLKWYNPKNKLHQSSDDDSWSSSSSASAVGGMFDGACDYATSPTGILFFGGDMAWDDLSPNQDQPQQWTSGSRVSAHGLGRSHSRGPVSNTIKRGPQHSGARDRSQDQFGQDCGHARSENKRSHNSPNPLTNAEQNSVSAKNKSFSSIVPRHSPSGGAVNRNGPNAAADAPAVVININHGSRSRREPTWMEASEADSVIDNVPWQNVGQDDKNSQSQRGRKSSPNNSVEHEGSKNSNHEGGNWQAQPAYGGNGGDTGYSNPDNWETAQPAMPGGWDASNDQDRANNARWDNSRDQHQANDTIWDNDQNKNSTTWKATNERSHESNNNGNTNETHNNFWDVQGKNNADNWENSNTQGQGNDGDGWNAKRNGAAPGWDFSTHQNQGQNQPWKPNENYNAAQNTWTGNSGWNDRGSNHQNGNSGKNQEPAVQSWGGKDEDKNWAEPTETDARKTATAPGFGNEQSKRRFSGSEKSHSPFRVMPDPNQVNKPSSSHPDGKQSGPQLAWVESSTTVPRVARQQSPPQLETHDGPNAPQMESVSNVGLGLLQPDDFQPKPYWSSWKQPKENDDRSKAFAPAFGSVEPLCKVPSEIAQRNNTTHQVHVDQSRPYAHRKASPKYMDSHRDPYAVFVFKYQSKAMLEQILNTKLTETEAEGRQRMHGMSKDELIEQILNAKANTVLHSSAGSESTLASNHSVGSKNTLKGNHTALDPNGPAANDVNLDAVNQELSHLQMHRNPSHHGSDKGPAHPDVRSGRDSDHNPPSWDRVPTASNHERVTGWLGSDHGASVRNGGSRNGANGGAGWSGNPSGSVSGHAKHDHDHDTGDMNAHTPAGGNGNWDGRANWTGQHDEGGGDNGW